MWEKERGGACRWGGMKVGGHVGGWGEHGVGMQVSGRRELPGRG